MLFPLNPLTIDSFYGKMTVNNVDILGCLNMADNSAQLRTVLLEMLSWFHNFCEENGLRYFAVGGTLLGAVRHKGLIPWDDDIDLGMPRADYERLEQLIGNRKNGRYYFETPNSNRKGYYYTYGKLFDTETTLVENLRDKLPMGVYLDIFPFDGLGDTKEDAVNHFNKIRKQQNLLATRVSGFRKGRAFYKNAAVAVARLIPSFLFDDKKLLHKIDAMCRTKDFETSKFVANINGNWGLKEITTREIVGTPTLYDFEDIKIYGIEDYDAYLKGVYGDWRKLPPEEKRVSQHDYAYVDFNTPCKFERNS